MKISIGTDHHGLKKKKMIIKYLTKHKIEVIDKGPINKSVSDFPDYAFAVAESVKNKEADYGILLCGTGIGMSIAANKVKGIRAAKISSIKEAKLAKEHNNANVITFSAKNPNFKIKDMLDSFLKAKPLNNERYERRNNKIEEYENGI